MDLKSPQREIYSKEKHSALHAQRLAQEIAFGPIVFQVSRLMVKFGILRMLNDSSEGLTMEEISQKSGISAYGTKILLESSLTIGTVLLKGEKFILSKTGWFLINDKAVETNMTFNHDVNYLGLYYLEEAILNGKPEGLRVFGNWNTIYEGLSELPLQTQKSWFNFDHFYSDCSFGQAIQIIFKHEINSILDVGGNTGRFAIQCIKYSDKVRVTIMDLPQQLEMMKKNISDIEGCDRIEGYGTNLLDKTSEFPTGFDVIWMSQFLDCFSEEEVISILTRAANSMTSRSRLYIMETFWDRQRFETASYCLTQISVYFTAMANGNSKMYYSHDMERCITKAGLYVETIHDELGQGHSIMVCKKVENAV